jgi:peroxiredoxin
LPFNLVSDPERRIIRQYDVQRRIPLLRNKRVTYVIDKGGIIRGVFHHELAIGSHRSDVLGALRALNDG